MTESERHYASWCARYDPHKFYIWSRWIAVRKAVLQADRFECQTCKTKYRRYRKADTVHHINHLKARPDLALEMYYMDPATHAKRRNLISLCHDCHEEAHGRQASRDQEPLTQERWD